MKNSENKKTPFAALGLIFGTAIGAGVAIIFSIPIYWGGVGTAVGLILGAAIDSFVNKKD